MTPETLNAWRVIPRLFMLLYALLLWRASEWFMGLGEPTGSQAAFISTMVGAAAGFFGAYCGTGASKKG